MSSCSPSGMQVRRVRHRHQWSASGRHPRSLPYSVATGSRPAQRRRPVRAVAVLMATHTHSHTQRQLRPLDRPPEPPCPRRALGPPASIACSEYPRQDWAARLLVSPRRAPPWVENPTTGPCPQMGKTPGYLDKKKHSQVRSCRRSADPRSSSSQSTHHWHSASGVLPPRPSSSLPPGHHVPQQHMASPL